MRNTAKTCGITIHQHVKAGIASEEATEKDPAVHLGSKLMESSWKPSEAMKKKKDKLPPSDHVGKSAVHIQNPSLPYSLFLWFDGLDEDDVCIADVVIDGKKSRGTL